MRPRTIAFAAMVLLAVSYPTKVPGEEKLHRLEGDIVDAASGKHVPARLTIRSTDGMRYLARSAADKGSAVPYQKARGPGSSEVHTTLSADRFVAELPPGAYELTAERGKEYLPAAVKLTLPRADKSPVQIKLRRWINMREVGWYSGDTHVHRSLEELPNVMLAEDLNVALPLTYWVTQSHTAPTRGDKNSPAAAARVIEVEPAHVIYPMNTEYEIFTVGGKRHTLGAVFALNHKAPLQLVAPPVRPIAEQVRREGGLLELDKHNWPWSMMLVPVMSVDLYELSNNHIWQTGFYFRRFGQAPPEYMRIEHDDNGMTEKGWIDFTLANYYTLLNCGFRMRPTAGTASGVHPVPLGFGSVYVHVPGEFSYHKWIDGLDAGRSFVTTGPMLQVEVNGKLASTTQPNAGPGTFRISGWAAGSSPLTLIEIVSKGEVVRALKPANQPQGAGGFKSLFDETFEVEATTWFAVRCWQRIEGRMRYAHSAPVFIDVPRKPLRPRRAEVDYLVRRMEEEIDRNRDVLSPHELAEYEEALAIYRKLLETAREEDSR